MGINIDVTDTIEAKWLKWIPKIPILATYGQLHMAEEIVGVRKAKKNLERRSLWC